MRRFDFFIIANIVILTSPVLGQQVNTGVSPIGIGDSFQQSIGTGWSVRGPGWFANFGGGTGGFGFSAQQGSSRSISGTSASLTTLNGAPGYLFSGTLTPFVTEITPIVGSPVMVSESPLHSKLRMAGGVQGLRTPLRLPETNANEVPAAVEHRPIARPELMPGGLATKGSSAEWGDLSVAEIRRQQIAETAARQAELDQLLGEAHRLEAAGDMRGAAGMYSRAAAKVEGKQRDEFVRKARQLRATK
jgi:hypothetical protein